jgi:hypothetical protein
LTTLKFLIKVVERVDDASAYSFKLGWPLMKLVYCFDLEIASLASSFLSKICSGGTKIGSLFENAPAKYESLFMPLIEVDNVLLELGFNRKASSGIWAWLTSSWRSSFEHTSVYEESHEIGMGDPYKRIQDLRVGCYGEIGFERLLRIKYDMLKIVISSYGREENTFEPSFREELFGLCGLELEKCLDLLKNGASSVHLKNKVLAYIASLLECPSCPEERTHCSLGGVMHSLWDIATTDATQLCLVKEIFGVLECFIVNIRSLDAFELTTRFLSLIIENLGERLFCGKQKIFEVMKCSVRVFGQKRFEEEEIPTVAGKIKEIISILNRKGKTRTEFLGLWF